MNRTSLSRRIRALGGLASMLLATSVGCVSMDDIEDLAYRPQTGTGVAHAADGHAKPVVRAQSPDRLGRTPGPAHNTKFVSHEGAPVTHGVPGEYCPPQGAYCPPGVPMHGAGLINCPPNYSYEFPGTPVYPSGTGPAFTGPGSPGAVVQYPYYTTKGPDDFFYDKDGRF